MHGKELDCTQYQDVTLRLTRRVSVIFKSPAGTVLQKQAIGLESKMTKHVQRRIAEEAARFMVDGSETEYLHAKERAAMMLGIAGQDRMPSNKEIKECILRLTRNRLGDEEVKRRLRNMREIALEVMIAIEDFDPFLIGSTLTGEIRESSDIDLHAYCDDHEILQTRLTQCGFYDIDVELVENVKGTFVHLRWFENNHPVEITIYPWSWREITPISSVTQKPMKRADLAAVRHLLR